MLRTAGGSGIAEQVFAGLGPTYGRMGRVLSLGQDSRWRRFLVSRVPVGASLVLDVATGTGLVAGELLGARGVQRVVGLDRSEPMLRYGVERASDLPISFVLGRAERLPFPDAAFDALTVTYLLRYVDDPATTLVELARVVRSGGAVVSLEFGVPTSKGWRALWRTYTRFGLPLLGRWASEDWHRVARFLGPSIEAFWSRYPLRAQLVMWRAAGLDPVRIRSMSFGAGVVLWAVKS
jgi:demethylmenaquinone methyltransferase/2-methoxy-6-polyprenyl-1,4-benzoquinol methylase